MIAGGVLIGAAVLGRFVLMPVVDQWQQARAAIVTYDAQLEDLERRVDRRDAAVRRLREKFGPGIEKDLLDVDAARVEFPRVVQETLAGQGFKLDNIRVQRVQRLREAPGVALVTLLVQGECEAGQIPKMLAALRGSEMLMLVDRVDLTMAKPGEREKWTASLTLATPALQEAAR